MGDWKSLIRASGVGAWKESEREVGTGGWKALYTQLVGYTYYKKGAVNATTAGAQSLYQLKLIVGESSGASGCDVHCENHCLDFPNDIRFTKEDGETKHDYWVEEITGTTPNRKATVWIEVASIPASGSVDFYMYYRKTSDSGESNGNNTFPDLFDDFEVERDRNKCGSWYATGSGVYHTPAATYTMWHRPMAVYAASQNKTFFVYGNYDNSPTISYYNHTTESFAEPIVLGTNPDDDSHRNPTVHIDEDGYIYVFWGAHGGITNVYKSTSIYDITAWTTKATIGSDTTYPQPWQLKNGEMFVLYRDGHPKKEKYIISTNGADSWSASTLLIDIGAGSNSVYAVSIAETGSYPRKVHIAWSYQIDTWDKRWDVYYAYSDDGGTTWKKRDGTVYTLPITQATAEKVYESGDEGVWLKDIQLDSNGNPYILFISANRTTYQGTWKTARYFAGSWAITDVTSSDHMYDGGALVILADNDMRIYAPTTPSQSGEDGGDVEEWKSTDSGQNWVNTKHITENSFYSHNHMRTVWNHQNSNFRVFWSYGDSVNPPATKNVQLYYYGEGQSNANPVFVCESPQWETLSGTVDYYSIEKPKSGSYSMKMQSNSVTKADMAHGGYVIEQWIWITSISAGNKIYFLQGDGVQCIFIAVFDDGKIKYYNGASWIETGTTITLQAWNRIGIQDIDWTAHTFDITLNRSVIQNDASMRPTYPTHANVWEMDGQFLTGDMYIDDVAIRKYASPEPTWGSWGSEQ